ncbi:MULTISPECIES: DEAD/DEAH box helicase [unclassified Bacillus (in: firmicutes)]|uniref:DEAD/DEAH box helicase n=1 Tax=unclassified Bacillus (in: firmicutes) TaxID=185979 RepID=UPI00111442F2|nr:MULTISPECIES: DEAD/DEAH box helicase [unclassified Bacillus (in: firmicutes)]
MMDLKGFLELGISTTLNDTLRENGIAESTPIQEKAIPVVLAGKDIIGQAKTGTGKTLAFILPILEKVNPKSSHVQALIVAPTRELALQITNEIQKMTVHVKDIHVLAIYGGQDVSQQMKKLQGNTHIVVATPGRLLDHLRRGTIELSHVSMLVLDEADQMLHFGFLPEVEEIIEQTPAERQTMLFSATMAKQIQSLAKRYMRKPEIIKIQSAEVTVNNITQRVVETTDRAKQDTLRQLMERDQPFLAVIFCRTKRRVTKLYEALKGYGYNCDELHGDLSQAKRERVMKRFRDAEIQYLIATDVAARGLDVEGVTHVFNYDIPEDVESYIHRIGRTGRAGGSGLAITLVAPKDKMYLQQIEKGINASLQRQVVEQPNKQEPEKKEQRSQKPREKKPFKEKKQFGQSGRRDRKEGPKTEKSHFGQPSKKKRSAKPGQKKRGR